MRDYQEKPEATSQYLNQSPRSLSDARIDATDRAIRDLRATIKMRAKQEEDR